jgi:hypothetical protein
VLNRKGVPHHSDDTQVSSGETTLSYSSRKVDFVGVTTDITDNEAKISIVSERRPDVANRCRDEGEILLERAAGKQNAVYSSVILSQKPVPNPIEFCVLDHLEIWRRRKNKFCWLSVARVPNRR